LIRFLTFSSNSGSFDVTKSTKSLTLDRDSVKSKRREWRASGSDDYAKIVLKTSDFLKDVELYVKIFISFE
jgi:hypothetical protein